MTSGKSTLVDITCEIQHETEKALLIFDGKRKAWLPKSATEVTENGVTVPEWLAQEKDLI